MQRDVLLLGEIIDAGERIRTLIDGLTVADLAADELRRDAVLWNYTVMGEAAATNVRPRIHHVDGHDLCRVQVDPAGFPVDAKVVYQKPNEPKETRTELFVRVANGTRALHGAEREKYVAQRWGTHRPPGDGATT